MRSRNFKRAVFIGALFTAALVLAHPFPPLWQNGAGAAVHFAPVAWPNEPANPATCGTACGDWKPYTRFNRTINDPRVQDPSNGGTAPQNYVNVSSSCSDKQQPSIYYYLYKDSLDPSKDVIMFRWRVEQAANNYATGPSAGSYSASSPWSSALWTVLFDIDGSGYRTLAAHLNGSSGSPAEPIDLLAGIWSNTPSQSLDYATDPNVHLLAHNPTAFIGSTGKILNYQSSLSPTESWPNGAAETVWDYGTTRAKLVTSSPCSEYFIDYQIPVAMLDASGQGGPKITRDTPIAMLFCTANGLNNPFQKDCAINRQWVASPTQPAPFGDYLSFNKTAPYEQPIISSVTATAPTSCPGTYTLTAKVQDALAVQNGVVVPTVKSVQFYYWYDRNGDGLANAADTGSVWTRITPDATRTLQTMNTWTASWDATGLAKGKYLIGVQAVDDSTSLDEGMTPTGIDHRTFSYLSGDANNEIYIGNAWTTGQQTLFPTHSPAQSPSGAEDWFGNPSVTGNQVALVGTAINACGVAPTITLVANPTSAATAATVGFTITIANPSTNSSAITLSSITDTLPIGFNYVSSSTGGTNGAPSTDPAISGQQLTWTLGAPLSMAPGTSAALSFSATAGSAAGNYSDTAGATTSFGTLVSAPATIVIDSARLSLSMSPSATSIAADGTTTLTYTLSYANLSGVAVTNASITNTLPAGVTYSACSGGTSCSNSAGIVTWTIGSLAGSATGAATLMITVPSSYSTFSLANSATLSAIAPDSSTVTASASATVAVTGVTIPGPPAFSLTSATSATTMAPGGTMTYTLTYTNYGTSAASSVVLTDTLPAGLTYSSCSNGCAQANGVATWNIGSVAAGASASVTLTATAADPFTYANPAVNSASLAWSGGTPVSSQINVGVTGQACSTYYYQTTTTNVGTDGVENIAASSPVPTIGSTGGSTIATAPVSGSPFLEVLRFYQDPQTANDVPFNGNVTSNIYIDRANGQGLNVRTTIYDYRSSDGAKVQLAQSTKLFTGSTRGLLTDTITPSGALQKGHRLLWIYEARSNHSSQTVQVQFQYAGTVVNSISGGSTFANSNATFCVTPPANLTLANQTSLNSLTAGATPLITYTLNYTNTGGASATTTNLIGALPSGFTNCQYSTNNSTWAACSSSGASPPYHTFAIGSVAGGASGTVYVRGNAPASATGGTTLTATSSITSDQTSSVTASATTSVVSPNAGGTPSLALNLVSNRTTAAPGADVVYTVTVINAGSAAASNVVVSNTVPAAAYYTYSSCTGSCGAASNSLVWPTLASLAAGASQSFTYTMHVGTSGLPSGITIINDDASASATGGLSATSNTVAVTLNGNPVLTLTNTPSLTSGLKPRDALGYTLTIANSGAADATAVTVVNPIPANTAFGGHVTTSAGTAALDTVNNRVVFNVGTLASGATATLTFDAVVNYPLPSGNTTLSSTATASASNAASQSVTATASASAAPSLEITKSAPSSVALPSARLTAAAAGTVLFVDRTEQFSLGQQVKIGNQVAHIIGLAAHSIAVDTSISAINGTAINGAITITVAYRNVGDANAIGAALRESLAPGFGYYAATPTPTNAPFAGSNGDVDWTLGSLDAGASGTAAITVFPSGSTGTFSNVATLSASNALTASATTVTGIGGLSVTKTTSTPVVSAGADASYTIVVSNSLGSGVSPVTVMDELPDGFTYKTGSATVGGSAVEPGFDASDTDHTQPRWTGLAIAAADTLVINFQAHVAGSSGATAYQNQVDIGAPAGVGVLGFDALLTTSEDVTVLAAASGVLKGYVYRRDSGGNALAFNATTDTPLTGVEVHLHKSGADCAHPVGGNCQVVYTDSNGFFEHTMPAEDWIVSVVDGTGDLVSGWRQISGANDDTVSVPDQGTVTDSNGFSSLPPASHLVSTSAGANGTISPSSQTVTDGGTTTFTITPDSGYGISSVSGCGGSLSGATYTTGAITGDCTVSATFVSNIVPPHTVTATAGTGGTISPTSAQVADGSPTTFTVTPDSGHSVAGASGCGGSLAGSTYTTAAITSDCAVTATFASNSVPTHTVTTIAGNGGALSPSSTNVADGGTTTFTVSANSGFQISSVSGCNGTLSGTTYTTGVITAACTVTASFAAITHTVSTSASVGGSISPTSATVTEGNTQSFTVTPNAGFSVSSVSGCGGSLVGTTYTTGAVANDCTVAATFLSNAIPSHAVDTTTTTGGSISPTSVLIADGSTTGFTLTANTGFHIVGANGCGGSLNGSLYGTAPITAACTVNASFAQNTYVVTSTAGAGGSITPASTNVAHGATTTFTVTPDSAHDIASVTGCGGTLTSNTYTTDAITGTCSVSASFVLKSYTVQSTAGAGGSISPVSISVAYGNSTTLSVTPDVGYDIAVVTGCGGSLSGTSYTTGVITGACSVNATFNRESYTVTASAGSGGAITPPTSNVLHGDTTTFTITPNTNYTIASVTGCGGSLSGASYTTGVITGACSVNATFNRESYTVTASAGSGGAITPPTSNVLHGDTTTFTITPNTNYTIASVTGCGGSLDGHNYVTSAITAACAVTATFAQVGPHFDPSTPASINAHELFTDVPLTIAPHAVDGNGVELAATLVGDSKLRPGRHILTWRAQDSQGTQITATQTLDIWPTISLSDDFVVGFGTTANFKGVLNGTAPQYPYSVAYTVGGDGGYGTLHTLGPGVITFNSGTEATVSFATLPQGTSFPTRHVAVTLDPTANIGARGTLTIGLISENSAPLVDVTVQQATRTGTRVARDSGAITLHAVIRDANPLDTHMVQWTTPTGALWQVIGDGRDISVDATSLKVGAQTFTVTATDSGTPTLTTRTTVMLAIIDTAPTLGTSDANGNGVTDIDDGWGDATDGVPNYLDRGTTGGNVLPEDAPVTDSYLIESDVGAQLRVGVYAQLNGAGGARLSDSSTTTFIGADIVKNVGGYFDLQAQGLLNLGQTVSIVIPQRQPVPQNPVYRLWNPQSSRWTTFAIDANNKLFSAPGIAGFCPPPESSEYQPGLVSGDWCVKIVIEDGGPNDVDHQKNGALMKSGGIAQEQNGIVTGTSGGGGGGAMTLEALALGLLALARRWRRHLRQPVMQLAATSALTISSAVHAQTTDEPPAPRQLYVAVTTGVALGSVDARDMDARLAAQGYTTHTTLSGQDRFAGMLDVGYRLRRVGVELGYADLGRLRTVVAGLTPVDDAYLKAISRAHPRSGNGPRVTALAFLPLSNRLELFARGGFFYWRTTMSAEGFSQFTDVKDRAFDPVLGVGARLQCSRRFRAQFELERYRLGGEKVDFVGIGVGYLLSAH